MIPLNTKCSGKMWQKLKYATEKNWSSGSYNDGEKQVKIKTNCAMIVTVWSSLLSSFYVIFALELECSLLNYTKFSNNM